MITIVLLLLNVASLLVVLRAVLSWFSPNPSSPIYPLVRFIHQVTEPVLAPIRRVLPSGGGIDFSPFVVIVAINFLLVPLVASL